MRPTSLSLLLPNRLLPNPLSLTLGLISFALLATPSGADDVYLRNGRVFEDVIAVVEGEKVVVHLPFGAMSVPRSTVERIETGETSLQEFGLRWGALELDAGAGAPEWIALARWALDRGLRHSAREAALEAARRDHGAEGLGPVMAALDYVFDPEVGQWIPRAESLERRGYVHSGGRWLSPEQQLARERSERQAALAREAAEERRLTRALLVLAATELAREPEPPRPTEGIYLWPGAVIPGFGIRHGHHRPPPRPDPSAIPIERRQPGSLFPIAPTTHRGGVRQHSAPGRAGSSSAAGGR